MASARSHFKLFFSLFVRSKTSKRDTSFSICFITRFTYLCIVYFMKVTKEVLALLEDRWFYPKLFMVEVFISINTTLGHPTLIS